LGGRNAPLYLWQLLRPYGRYVYYLAHPHRRPSYFSAPWRFRTTDLASLGGHEWKGERAFVILPMSDWHVRRQRPQHLAAALASMGYPCLFVNPHLGLEYSRPFAFDPKPRITWLDPRLAELHVHLPAEHELSTRPLYPEETERIAAAILEALAGLGVSEGAILAGQPVWRDAGKSIRSKLGFPLIYDCHDLLCGFGRVPPGVVSMEEELIDVSDYVLFSSNYLETTQLARNPALRSKSALLRNAYAPGPAQSAPAMPDRPPVVGYAGALDHWFDADAVAAAAERHPNVRFAILGKVESRPIRRLGRFSNVELTGEVPYRETRERTARWSAALIPFKVMPLTLATDPVKLYEYFSDGLPVISSRLPEVERFGNLVYIADTPDRFADEVERALREEPALRDRRKIAVASETWTNRANRILELLGWARA